MGRTVRFEILREDAATRARLGRMSTPHGVVDTPSFMPVGTAGTVKALLPEEVEATGAQVILGNTFHLYLRPGHEVVKKLGGLHAFMQWPHTILTDSGGFQVLSLRDLGRTIEEDGVNFRSPYDGSRHFMSPELSLQIQEALGADIAMAFDECPPYNSARGYLEGSLLRTTRWLDRCLGARTRPEHTSLFGIVQGAGHEDLRRAHAEAICSRDLDGYAIGGVAVGEPFEEMWRVVALTAPLLPKDRPRYLMGVGYPRDLLESVAAGVDLFDCVIPTRNARNGRVFTQKGYFSIKLAENREHPGPIDEACQCPTCARFSRAYLRHLFTANEVLGLRLLTLHNVWFFQCHMAKIREAIRLGTFESWLSEERKKTDRRDLTGRG